MRPVEIESIADAYVRVRREWEGWHQARVNSAVDADAALATLDAMLRLHAYPAGDRDRVDLVLREALQGMWQRGGAEPPQALLRYRIAGNQLLLTLEAPGRVKGGVLTRGLELKWAHYHQADGRLLLEECRIVY